MNINLHILSLWLKIIFGVHRKEQLVGSILYVYLLNINCCIIDEFIMTIFTISPCGYLLIDNNPKGNE